MKSRLASMLAWLRSGCIGLCVLAITLNTAIKAIVRVKRGRMTRPIANDYAHQWARRLLRTTQTTLAPPQFAQPIAYQPGRCYIIMSNHASHYDIPIILESLPDTVRMIAKRSLFQIPLFGRMLRENEFISLHRDNPQEAMADLEKAQQVMHTGVALWIAPEGTRNRDPTRLNPFKIGGFVLAINAQATIIPVGIRGSGEVLPAKRLRFHTGKTVHVHVGQPIDASQYTLKTRKQLRQRVEQSIETLCGFIAVP